MQCFGFVLKLIQIPVRIWHYLDPNPGGYQNRQPNFKKSFSNVIVNLEFSRNKRTTTKCFIYSTSTGTGLNIFLNSSTRVYFFLFVSIAAADKIGRPAAGVTRGLNTLRDNSRWLDSKWYGRNYLEAGLCRSLGAPQSLVLLLNGLQRPLHMEPGCLRK